MKVNEQIKISSTLVEIFKTNVNNRQLANIIIADLNQLYPEYHINFDLEDCDKVLRIESYTGIDILGILNYGSLNNLEINLIDY